MKRGHSEKPTCVSSSRPPKFSIGKEKKTELENDPNPFAVVTLASLKTHESNHQTRASFKFNLTKMLYERGYSGEMILALYEFLDGIMVLPETMEKIYLDQVDQYEEESQMPYITSAERIGIEKGMIKGIEKGMIKGIEKGMIKGIEKGMIKGKIEGKIEELLEVLSWTAPTIIEKYQAQIKAAKTEQQLEAIKKDIRAELNQQQQG